MNGPFEFAITSDFSTDVGDPAPTLRQIAASGARWVHWCHHWSDDFLYGAHELRELEAVLRDTGLRIHDLHGSNGREKAWDSVRNAERLAGVDLVRNRVEMAQRFGCEVVIMHPARPTGDPKADSVRLDSLLRSIDELQPDLSRSNVRLAIENMAIADSFDQLDRIAATFPPDRVGICYDPGHGCIAGNGLDRLEMLADRLIATHLNDNDAATDLHQPPFMGSVDWRRLASIIRKSTYDREVLSTEVAIGHSGMTDVAAFLKHTLGAAARFGDLVSAGAEGA